MAGKRINLSDLAEEPPLEDARIPAFADSTPRTARVGQIAANPLNTRDVHAHPAKIESIGESMRVHGQLQPCTVVTRTAFLAIFPEHEDTIGNAIFVQVTGGRRLAAAIRIERPTLDIVVRTELAATRAQFVSATAAENIDREDYDPIEEARAVALLVKEAGSKKTAADQLARTPPWVTQRLNLLKLVPDLQAAVRAGEIPLREVRDLHDRSDEEQSEALANWRSAREARGGGAPVTLISQRKGGEPTSAPERTGVRGRPKLSVAAVAIRQLGGTPVKIAEALRAELAPADVEELAELLTRVA